MPLQTDGKLFDKGGTCLIGTLIEEKLSVIGPRGQPTKRAGRPVKSETFLPVFEAGDLTATVLLLLELLL